jgi:hypothetical protein
VQVPKMPTTTESFRLLRQAVSDLAKRLNTAEFTPLLESDLNCLLFHDLLQGGCPLRYLYAETRVRGITKGNRRYDIVIGNSETTDATVEPCLMWVPEIMAFFFQIFWRHHFVPQTPCQVGDDESGMMARQPQSAVPSPALDQLLPPPNHDHVVPLPSW